MLDMTTHIATAAFLLVALGFLALVVLVALGWLLLGRPGHRRDNSQGDDYGLHGLQQPEDHHQEK